MPTRYTNPAKLGKPPGYTHVVEVTAPTRLVFLAGQLGSDPDGNFAGGKGDFRAQAVQVFENMKTALATAGGGFEHLVKITNFLVDIAHLPILREVRSQYIGDNPPASTLLVISKLARPDALLEIEAIAAMPPRAARAKKKVAAAKSRQVSSRKVKTAARKRR